MKKFIITVNIACQKDVYLEAETAELATERALDGLGLRIGDIKILDKLPLSISRVLETEMEIRNGHNKG